MKRQLKIGIFLAGALAILASFIFVVGDMSELFRKRGYTLSVMMDSALGLEKTSAVKMAGIKIGVVKDILLEGRRARVVMGVYPQFKVPKGSKGTLATLGLLGERFMEIEPGTGEGYCLPGDTLEGKQALSFDQIGAQALSVGDEIKKLSADIRALLGDDAGDNLHKTLGNLATLTAELNAFLAGNKDEIGQTIREATKTFQDVSREIGEASGAFHKAVAEVEALAGDNRESVKGSMEKIREILAKIDSAVDRLDRSLEKIDKGEGSVGKLINDDALYEEVKGAVGTVGKIAGPMSSLQARIELRGDYYPDSKLFKGGLSLDLRPGRRLFISGGITNDPWRDRFVYSLQAGPRWGGLVVRAGIIESTFGAGLDFDFLRNRLNLGLEAFDFNRSPRPRFRAYGKYYPIKNLFLVAGIDDFTLAPKREFFFGLGISLR